MGVTPMDYADKQRYLALRGAAEEEGDEKAAQELRESFAAAQKAAETGDPVAQFNLALHYDYGFGTEEDEAAAFKWFEKAAVQGHAAAMHCLSWAYEKGNGVEPDKDKSKEWEKKAAFTSFKEGGYGSALYSIRGNGYNDDPEINDLLSRIQEQMEAEKGYAKELCELGELYRLGNDAPQDTEKALALFHKSAERGCYDAQVRLGKYYKNSLEHIPNAAPDFAKAAEWFQKAAEQDDLGGQLGLAGLYRYGGGGVAPDREKAIEWYMKASRYNNPVAEKALKEMLGEKEATVKLLHMKAGIGNWFAQYDLAEMYRYGDGVPQDREKALEWVDKSAERGYEPALKMQKELVDEIIKEKGAYVINIDMTQPDSPEKLYQKGRQMLSYGYGDVAVPLLRMAADRGNVEAQYMLAEYLYNPQEGSDSQDEIEKLFPHNEEAMELYRKAAAAGNEKAKEALKKYE